MRPRNPTIKLRPPKDSAAMARQARNPGIPIWENIFMLAEKPGPPNQPNSFCAPWARKTKPSANLITVNAQSSLVEKSRLNIKTPLLKVDVEIGRWWSAEALFFGPAQCDSGVMINGNLLKEQ